MLSSSNARAPLLIRGWTTCQLYSQVPSCLKHILTNNTTCFDCPIYKLNHAGPISYFKADIMLCDKPTTITKKVSPVKLPMQLFFYTGCCDFPIERSGCNLTVICLQLRSCHQTSQPGKVLGEREWVAVVLMILIAMSFSTGQDVWRDLYFHYILGKAVNYRTNATPVQEHK